MATKENRTADLVCSSYEIAWQEYSILSGLTPDEHMFESDIGVSFPLECSVSDKSFRLCFSSKINSPSLCRRSLHKKRNRWRLQALMLHG